MYVMGTWNELEPKYAKEISLIKRLIQPYDYTEKHANNTDRQVKNTLLFQLRLAKNMLTELMSTASREQDETAMEIKRLRDDIDLAIDEIEALVYWKFPENKDSLEKIVKADILLLNNIELFLKSAKSLKNNAPSLGKENIQMQLDSLRKNLSDSRAIFLERADIIKFKK